MADAFMYLTAQRFIERPIYLVACKATLNAIYTISYYYKI